MLLLYVIIDKLMTQPYILVLQASKFKEKTMILIEGAKGIVVMFANICLNYIHIKLIHVCEYVCMNVLTFTTSHV